MEHKLLTGKINSLKMGSKGNRHLLIIDDAIFEKWIKKEEGIARLKGKDFNLQKLIRNKKVEVRVYGLPII